MGHRVAAVLIDHVIIYVSVYLSIVTYLQYSGIANQTIEGASPRALFLPWGLMIVLWAPYIFLIFGSEAILLFLFFLPSLLYFTILEGQTGQTLGKMILNIRAVDEASQKPAGIIQAFVRNLVRIIDMLPLFYIVGFFVSATDKRRRRVGDIVARTTVVRVQKERRRVDDRIVHKIVLRELD